LNACEQASFHFVLRILGIVRHIQMKRHTMASSEQVCPRGFWFGYTRRPEPGPFYSTADYPDPHSAGAEREESRNISLRKAV
jgi:hypothetical protein